MVNNHTRKQPGKHKRIRVRKQPSKRLRTRKRNHQRGGMGGINLPWPFAQPKNTNTINVVNYLKDIMKFLLSLEDNQLDALKLPEKQIQIKAILKEGNPSSQTTTIQSASPDKELTSPAPENHVNDRSSNIQPDLLSNSVNNP